MLRKCADQALSHGPRRSCIHCRSEEAWCRYSGTWYSALAKDTSNFVLEFCLKMAFHGIDGWRNPWDQDEIMLCRQSLPKMTCREMDRCPATSWVRYFSIDMQPDPTNRDDPSYTIVNKAEKKPEAHRFSYFVLPRDRTDWSKQTFDTCSARENVIGPTGVTILDASYRASCPAIPVPTAISTAPLPQPVPFKGTAVPPAGNKKVLL